MNERLLNRFTYAERLIHWVVGISFVILLLTGFAFSYPSLFWLTTLAGGGGAARLLHPWVGVIFSSGMVFMLAFWVRDMFLDREDWRWLGAVRDYAARRHDKVPPAGKYNAGQKAFFWLQGALAIVFVVTGMLLWIPDWFSASVLSLSRLFHYASALAGGLLLVVHVYLGTVAYPGTARGMIDGKVTRSWAAFHHPRWYEDQSGS